jgi:hypothetical protein
MNIPGSSLVEIMPIPHFPHDSHMHSPANPRSQRWFAKLILQNGFHRLCINHACGSGQTPTQQSPQLILVGDGQKDSH